MANPFWPDIQDQNDAHKACGQGAGVAFFVALVTGVVAYLQMNGKAGSLPKIGATGFLDAGLFFIIGVGICFHSRLASLIGLVLFAAEKIYMAKTFGINSSGIVTSVFFALGFISSVRGSFAWHDFRRQEKEHEQTYGPPIQQVSDPNSPTVTEGDATPVTNKKKRIAVILLVTVILASVATLCFFILRKKNESSLSLKSKESVNANITNTEPQKTLSSEKLESSLANIPVADSSANKRTFHLKSGETVSGRVLLDDPDYVNVETSSGQQKTVIKEDIASEE